MTALLCSFRVRVGRKCFGKYKKSVFLLNEETCINDRKSGNFFSPKLDMKHGSVAEETKQVSMS